MVRVGCCGFPRGRQYSVRSKLVEVQQTFYKPPRLQISLRWRRESPADFEFHIVQDAAAFLKLA